MVEYKELNSLDLKFEEEGTITGYCSVKNTLDAVGDVIVNGPYKNLDRTIKQGFTCLNHEHQNLPVGYILNLVEDEYGLKFTAKFHSTKEGQDVYTVVKERLAAGLDMNLSIGYKTIKYSFGEFGDNQARFLEEIFVKEITFTLFPANELATVTGLKTRPQEYKDLAINLNCYIARLVEIKDLGRKDNFIASATEELAELNNVINLALKEHFSALAADNNTDTDRQLVLEQAKAVLSL